MPLDNNILKHIKNTYLFHADIEKSLEHYYAALNQTNNQEVSDYGHSLIYFLQSARNFWAYSLDEDNSLITITTRYPRGRKPYVLVYPIGNDIKKLSERCYDIALDIRKLTGEKVILKKVPQRNYEHFIKMGFTDYKEHHGWNVNYRYDDDDYPEFLIDVEHYVKGMRVEKNIPVPYAPKTTNLRGYARRFIRWLERENCGAQVQTLDGEKDVAAVADMIHNWAKFRRDRHPEEDLSDLIDSHMCFLNGLWHIRDKINDNSTFVKEKLKNAVILTIYKKSKGKILESVVGFGLMDAISYNTAGFYSEIALHQRKKTKDCSWEKISKCGIPGCAEVLLLFMLKSAAEKRFRYINFGGSEHELLQKNRMLKFPIFFENRMRHLVLY
ncbi:hypothetical protein EH223_11050 [candidate division KSB1 bacterium]|nr:MAG: hypothetical protein EH223_11050 [candidate division KSB1 bacterium]